MASYWQQGQQIETRDQKDCALAHLENQWLDKNCDKRQILSDIRSMFFNVKDPFSVVSYFLSTCCDNKDKSTNTLTFFIIKQFNSWIDDRDDKKKLFQLLNDTVRLEALENAIRGNCTYLEMIVNSFDLLSASTNIYIPYINRCIALNKYKEAAQCATILGLQESFHVEELLVPLLAQDKMSVMERLLENSPLQQAALLRQLDKMCMRNFFVMGYISKLQIPDARLEKLNYKTLSKLAVRLMKKYGFEEETCENIMKERRFSQLKFLLHKKFESQRDSSESNWDELIESVVIADTWLQDRLLSQLCLIHETDEAARWAQKLRVPTERLSDELKKLQRQHSRDVHTHATMNPVVSAAPTENWDNEIIATPAIVLPDPNYFHLTLADSDITLVNTPAGLVECANYLRRCGSPIGFDAEWRPVFTTSPIQVSLLQLGTETRVYLVDVYALKPVLSEEQWQHFFRDVFCDEKVTVLGYGLNGDLRELSRTLPCLVTLYDDIQGVIDLCPLHNQIVKAVGDSAPEAHGFCDVDDPPYEGDEFDDYDFSKPTPHRRPKQKKVKSNKTTNRKTANDAVSTGDSAPAKTEKGLSELVLKYLGKPLNKADQMSDWEKRPLRREQIRYAALDAVVLVLLHKKLMDHAIQIRTPINFRPPPNMKWMHPTKGEKKRKPVKDRIGFGSMNDPYGDVTLKEVYELKFVAEGSLTEAAKELRSCGLDITIVSDTASLIQSRYDEERRILIPTDTNNEVMEAVGESWCYHVPDGLPRTQTICTLRRFRIKVTLADLYSRCTECNNGEFHKIPRDALVQFWGRSHEKLGDLPEGLSHAPDPPHEHIDFATLTLSTDVALQVSNVSVELMNSRRKDFDCCKACGAVVNQSIHFTVLSDQFNDVLSLHDQ